MSATTTGAAAGTLAAAEEADDRRAVEAQRRDRQDRRRQLGERSGDADPELLDDVHGAESTARSGEPRSPDTVS